MGTLRSSKRARHRGHRHPQHDLWSIAHFDDLLSHGYLDHHADASDFTVDSLNSTQYEALVTLAESYFAAGYEWFSPLALRPIDQERLRRRFSE